MSTSGARPEKKLTFLLVSTVKPRTTQRARVYTRILCWLISSYSKHEYQTQYSQNETYNPKKYILIRLLASRVCSQSTLILIPPLVKSALHMCQITMQ